MKIKRMVWMCGWGLLGGEGVCVQQSEREKIEEIREKGRERIKRIEEGREMREESGPPCATWMSH